MRKLILAILVGLFFSGGIALAAELSGNDATTLENRKGGSGLVSRILNVRMLSWQDHYELNMKALFTM